MKTVLCLAFLAALGLAAVLPASAQEKSWVGELVLYTKPPKEIQFGDRVGNKQVSFPFSGYWPIHVLADREGWLRIHDQIREGWVDKADFVLVRDAPAFFHRRVQANPKDTFALHMRGVGWLQKGEPDNAIKDFDECIRLDPTNSNSFSSRGIAWKRKNEINKALADYDEAIRLNPENALAYINRRGAWVSKKEYGKALADCTEAIRLNPKFANFYYNKACVYALQRRTDPAIETLREALELGYRNFQHMEKDTDLDPIRNDARYKELLKKFMK